MELSSNVDGEPRRRRLRPRLRTAASSRRWQRAAAAAGTEASCPHRSTGGGAGGQGRREQLRWDLLRCGSSVPETGSGADVGESAGQRTNLPVGMPSMCRRDLDLLQSRCATDSARGRGPQPRHHREQGESKRGEGGARARAGKARTRPSAAAADARGGLVVDFSLP